MGPLAGADGRATACARAAQWLLVAALALHASLIVRDDRHAATASTFRFANALSLVAGLAVLVAWLSGLLRTLPQRRRGGPAGRGGVRAAAARSPQRRTASPSPSEPWAAVHIAVALLAYALFVVAALQALVLTGLEKRLHRGLPDATRDAQCRRC